MQEGVLGHLEALEQELRTMSQKDFDTRYGKLIESMKIENHEKVNSRFRILTLKH